MNEKVLDKQGFRNLQCNYLASKFRWIKNYAKLNLQNKKIELANLVVFSRNSKQLLKESKIKTISNLRFIVSKIFPVNYLQQYNANYNSQQNFDKT